MDIENAKLLVRCSSLGLLMSRPRGKTNAEKFADLENLLKVETEKYEAIKNKASKTAINKLEKLTTITKELEELKPHIDKWELSETAKSYIKQQAKEDFFGYRKNLDMPVLTKGHRNEEESIQLVNDFYKTKFKKNEVRKTSAWLTGECDIVSKEKDIIIDMKNAWSIDTFPVYEEEVNDKCNSSGYFWQGRGYMRLYSINRFVVAYVFTSTPEDLIPAWEQKELHQADHIDPSKRITFSKLINRDRLIEKEMDRAYKVGNEYYKECLTKLVNKNER